MALDFSALEKWIDRMILDREDSEALKFVDFVLMEAEHTNPEFITHAGPSTRPYRIESTQPSFSLEAEVPCTLSMRDII